jgi:ABC-type phosphate transport system substrate-binding protein
MPPEAMIVYVGALAPYIHGKLIAGGIDTMSVSWARRCIVACIPMAAAVAALAVPGAAHAELLLQCEGANILARGSTIQGGVAQDKVWNLDFNTSANGTGCNGTQGTGAKPTVEYLQTEEEDRGSGACLKAFGVGVTVAKFDRYSYCGTDEAPNAAQKSEIERFGVGAGEKSLETIPVLQAPVAIIVHLPAGCTGSANYKEGEKTDKPTRLVLNDTTLEGIYRGRISKWSEITDGGDKLVAEKGKTCNTEAPITRIVRKDKSGTTHIFKEFLASVNRLNEAGEENKKAEEKWIEKAGVERTWKEVASGSENVEWPEAANVVRPAGTGGPEVVNLVAATESSIGYANLADAFENGSFDKKGVGGGGTGKFWVKLQNKTTLPVTYVDPADKEDTETPSNANCAKTVYTNGEEVFPPKSTRAVWSEAQAKLTDSTYSLCGLTYDLALREYGKYHDELGGVGAQPSEAQATTAESYLLFELNEKTEGGGKLIEKHEYEKVPTTILGKAEAGVKEIGFQKSGVKFVCATEASEGTGTLFYKTKSECETLNAPGAKGIYKR